MKIDIADFLWCSTVPYYHLLAALLSAPRKQWFTGGTCLYLMLPKTPDASRDPATMLASKLSQLFFFPSKLS